jgi:hypothetical protein
MPRKRINKGDYDMPKLTGGGIQSSKRVEVPIRTGAPSARVGNVRGVSQLGASQGGRLRQEGSHTSKPTGSPVFDGTKASPVMLGNEKALDVQGGGPGKGRTVMPSGGQGVHGPVAGTREPFGRNIWSEYPGVPTTRGR